MWRWGHEGNTILGNQSLSSETAGQGSGQEEAPESDYLGSNPTRPLTGCRSAGEVTGTVRCCIWEKRGRGR